MNYALGSCGIFFLYIFSHMSTGYTLNFKTNHNFGIQFKYIVKSRSISRKDSMFVGDGMGRGVTSKCQL